MGVRRWKPFCGGDDDGDGSFELRIMGKAGWGNDYTVPIARMNGGGW